MPKYMAKALKSRILEDDRAVCMLVETIAKKSKNEKWSISIDGRTFSHERIRRVSMDKFYGIVFGKEDAFARLCMVLPEILDDVVAELRKGAIENSVYEELSQLSPDAFRSLFLLAFKTYDGFLNF